MLVRVLSVSLCLGAFVFADGADPTGRPGSGGSPTVAGADPSSTASRPAPAPTSSGPDAPVPPSVARAWTEALLFAIRHDLARPPVHARNAYHLAVAMYDAWAAVTPIATTVLLGTSAHPACTVDTPALAAYRAAVRIEPIAAHGRAVGQAAWRLLCRRYARAADAVAIRDRLDARARATGLDWLPGDPAAAFGARAADCVLGAGRRDDANEDGGYRNLAYAPVNPPLDPTLGGNDMLVAPSRWQPLAVRDFRDQAGRSASPTEFIGADWGLVRPLLSLRAIGRASCAAGSRVRSTTIRDRRRRSSSPPTPSSPAS